MNSPIKLPPLEDAAILRLWDTHVGEPDTKRPLTDADKIAFARAVVAAQPPAAWLNMDSLARLSKPHVAGCAAAIENRPRGGFVPIAVIPENNHE
ncbi:hypothetical protein [Achromobacter ruhlandii]|uniref:Uncharacterized protein n=1 Tax=Achromobacter ruhlandii TaxID=72557 RepID=A0A2M9GPI8_9BURK|nr:hypothetical protein [Achromobacter ruhlandii]PJM66444.1 hypothetical protein CV751_30260 [Achromobacter ruhlandii]CAB3919891.1 hypothetical protein LMG3328_05300 [Achromobacter ruhlandii]